MVSGAVALALLVLWRNPDVRALARTGSWASSAALLVYAAAFSLAYLALDAGLGALILFAGVQVTMFAGSLLAGESLHPARWLGAAVGLSGLARLLAPGATAPPLWAAGMMTLAAAGWGVYSLRGRVAKDPLADTAGNFLRAAPAALALWLVLPGDAALSRYGVALAVASGALASGLGYALWYAVLPRMEASLAAVAQLTVPLIALAGGILFLSEVATLRFGVAAILVIAGVLIAIYGPRVAR